MYIWFFLSSGNNACERYHTKYIHSIYVPTTFTKSMTYSIYKEILLGIAKQWSSKYIGRYFAKWPSFYTFISDRHSTISKHMREKFGRIKHYFDPWDLKKSKYKYEFVLCNKCF